MPSEYKVALEIVNSALDTLFVGSLDSEIRVYQPGGVHGVYQLLGHLPKEFPKLLTDFAGWYNANVQSSSLNVASRRVCEDFSVRDITLNVLDNSKGRRVLNYQLILSPAEQRIEYLHMQLTEKISSDFYPPADPKSSFHNFTLLESDIRLPETQDLFDMALLVEAATNGRFKFLEVFDPRVNLNPPKPIDSSIFIN